MALKLWVVRNICYECDFRTTEFTFCDGGSVIVIRVNIATSRATITSTWFGTLSLQMLTALFFPVAIRSYVVLREVTSCTS